MLLRAVVFASLVLPGMASGQRVQGHVLGGYGLTSGSRFAYGSSQIGLGLEMLIARGLGLGGDVTAVTDDYQTVGIGSLNGVYRVARLSKTDLYISGGFSSASAEAGVADRGLNIGFGVNWWKRPSLGLRFEPRYFGINLGSRPVHIFGARVGIIFGGGKERRYSR